MGQGGRRYIYFDVLRALNTSSNQRVALRGVNFNTFIWSMPITEWKALQETVGKKLFSINLKTQSSSDSFSIEF